MVEVCTVRRRWDLWPINWIGYLITPRSVILRTFRKIESQLVPSSEYSPMSYGQHQRKEIENNCISVWFTLRIWVFPPIPADGNFLSTLLYGVVIESGCNIIEFWLLFLGSEVNSGVAVVQQESGLRVESGILLGCLTTI